MGNSAALSCWTIVLEVNKNDVEDVSKVEVSQMVRMVNDYDAVLYSSPEIVSCIKPSLWNDDFTMTPETHIIKNQGQFDNGFTAFPPNVNLETQMLLVHAFMNDNGYAV